MRSRATSCSWMVFALYVLCGLGCVESRRAQTQTGDAAVDDASVDMDAASDAAGADAGDAGAAIDSGRPDAGDGGPDSPCGPDGLLQYLAHGSHVTGFSEGAKVRFFADSGDEKPKLYAFDGTSLTSCEASDLLDGRVLAQGTFEGAHVFLTNGGVYRKTGDCELELLKELSPRLNLGCCLYPQDLFLIEFDGRLFFRGATDGEDLELWALSPSDGQIEVFDLMTGADTPRASAPAYPQVFADQLWFTAHDPDDWKKRALFRYDGSVFTKVLDQAEHTLVVGDALYVVGASQVFRIDASFNTTSVFTAPNWTQSPLGAIGASVYVVDVFSSLYEIDDQGSRLVADLQCGQPPTNFVTTQGALYWSCDDQFGAYDPVAGKATILSLPEGVSIYGSPLVAWSSGIMFVGSDRDYEQSTRPIDFQGTGREPWNWSFAAEEARMIADLHPGYDLDCD